MVPVLFPRCRSGWRAAPLRAIRLSVAGLCLSSAALAGPAPKVVADIAPVQSLVAIVMAGVGTPSLLVPVDASPHSLALKPSQARALSEADFVVWVGPELEPWLDHPLDSLAPDAARLSLLDDGGAEPLPFRQGMAVEGHDDHDDHADHDDHDDHEGDEHGHHHGDEDPHAWLDPAIGRKWLGAIAAQLAEVDPENAGTYRANAEAGQVELLTLERSVAAELAPVRDRAFVTGHDAFQYFEHRFGLNWVGSVAGGDATAPGPRRIAELRDVLAERDVVCAFSDPQVSDKLLRAVIEGTDIRLGTMDPIGRTLPEGPAHYAALITGLADALKGCVAE
ncbi:zinc ABC transporter substrate-binding protein [Chachezhania sediminis]|uniref:zinc ABC transporter substrate-binding protein n=1 Tax=Chachezhania sediminis TaxID=2599291 RepID=UPI00131E3149|nr:zinc ABC transporter substrate-binding protein [Chachezhania sediminis]